MCSSRGYVEISCVSTPARKGPTWSHVPWTAGPGLFCFFSVCRCSIQFARFGYRQTEMKHNKFKTNKLTTTASQDQSQKPQQEYVFSNLHVSGIPRQMEMKHQFQNRQVDNSSLDQTKSKTTGAPICSPWTVRENHSPNIQRVKTPGYTL